jgi:hypothetical protein
VPHWGLVTHSLTAPQPGYGCPASGRFPYGCKNVARPGPYGNPFTIAEHGNEAVPLFRGLLAFTYGLGLGIPFLITALAVQCGATAFAFARRHARAITRTGGALLILVGLLEVTGTWTHAVAWLTTHAVSGYQSPL